MSARPAVSVIMANYNGARHLAEAIGSVQRQTLADWELILVDDASPDDSVRVAEDMAKADPRIRVLVQARNLGPAAARNRALDVAQGDWIAIADSDDVMLPERLERLLARAQGQGAEIVADDQLVCSADLSERSPFMGAASARRLARVDLATFVDSSRLYASLPDLGFIKPLIKAELIRRAGARYDESLRVSEDFHFLVSLLAADAELRLEPEPLYLYRKHSGSISHRLTAPVIASMIAADAAAAERLKGRAGPGQTLAVRALERRIAGWRSWAVHEQVMASAKAGRWAEAARAALGRPHAWRLISRPLRERLARSLRSVSRRPSSYTAKFEKSVGTTL